jgi:hypothetical protein
MKMVLPYGVLLSQANRVTGISAGINLRDPVHEEQLIRLNRHFHHPSTNKILSLLKRPSPDEVDRNTKRLLENISNACITCKTYSTKPVSFQICTPDDVIWLVRLYLMYLDDRRPVLHIVDQGTTFQSACFLPDEDVLSETRTRVPYRVLRS